jgi:hypothetical protein
MVPEGPGFDFAVLEGDQAVQVRMRQRFAGEDRIYLYRTRPGTIARYLLAIGGSLFWTPLTKCLSRDADGGLYCHAGDLINADPRVPTSRKPEYPWFPGQDRDHYA